MIDVEVALWLVHLVANTRVGVMAGYELHDHRTHALEAKLTGRAQYATCMCCRKTIASWKARVFTKRTRALRLEPAIEAQLEAHSPACVETWLWPMLAKWSTGFATPHEAAAIELWRERYVEGALARVNMRDVFTKLPAPPGSELAQELEVLLITLSRLWR